MKGNTLKSLLISVICGFYAFGATAAVSLFSDYGQIQNVQNYSSNPFWSPNAPYNQRLPQPVYATGADLNSDDCQKVVQSLVAAQCMARENCKNTDVSDIRPTIMVQLSNLPGHNYVSACSGYIDGIFESYVQQYGNTLPNRPTAFPNATTPTLNDSGGIQFNNPYKKQPTDWQKEQTERAKELEALQKQNGTGNERLTRTDFPATYADLSFSERMENDREGLMPYKDAVAYKTLNVKTAEEWCDEHPNSTECWNWKCGKNGREANKPECTTYRCSKADYYAEHTDECKRNELCKDNSSTQCMQYRCYQDPDQDFEDCKKWKCQNDEAYNAEFSEYCSEKTEGTVDPENPDGDDNALLIRESECAPIPKPEHFKKGQLDDNGVCKVIECEEGWLPNKENTACEQKGIILALYSESGGSSKPRRCFNRCGQDNANDGLNKTLHEANLLPQDKNVCTLSQDPGIYYTDDLTKQFVVPLSKKNELQSAITRITNSVKYGCYPFIYSDIYYIVLKDAQTNKEIDGSKLYIIKSINPLQ